MSSILKHKKLIILILFIAVFSIFLFSKSKLSFLTAFNRNNAEYNLVQEEDKKIKLPDDSYVDGVTFDVYFLKDIDNDGNADGLRGANIENGKSEKIYFDLNVSGDKKVTDATLIFVNENVKVGGTLAKSSVIPSNLSNIDYKKINLSQEINPGTSSFFYLNVTPNIDSDLKKYSGTNKVLFKGTAVDIATGEETKFEKEIVYNIDSYSTKISTGVTTTATSNVFGKAIITYEITTQENNDAMPIKSAHLDGSIADFEGYHPSSVVVKSADYSNITFDYNSDSQTFTARKDAIVNDDNVITKQAYNTKNGSTRYNKWIIEVVYDLPEDIVLDNKVSNISISAYYKGFTDINLTEKKSNVVNRVISHILSVRPHDSGEAFIDGSYINVGKKAASINAYFVDKSFLEDAYIGQQTGNFTFNEDWILDSYTPTNSSFVYNEIGTTIGYNKNISPYTNYKTMKLAVAPTTGNYKISVYNAENDELLFIIDKNNANDTLEFPNDIHKLKIITNEVSAKNSFGAKLEFVKEIDSNLLVNNVEINDFLSYNTIRNSGIVLAPSYSETSSNPFYGNATFSDSYSNAYLTTSNTQYSREISKTSIPMSFKIEHNNVDIASKLWAEGFYLIKLPKEIIGVENVSITPSNNVVNYEIINIDNQQYIKFINKMTGSNNTKITVNFDAIVDPKETDCNGYVELYAINNTNTLYNNSRNDIYDVDSDGSTSDKAAHSSIYISIKAPNELLTGSIIKDYDDNGSETVSPLIADVNPISGDSDANVEVFIINNSEFKIKNIDLVGKIAFQGNKYEALDTEIDLGSEYDVYLAGPIQIPSNLNGHVNIYYSTNEKPTRDLTDTNNGWVTEVTDYSTIKSYMIKVDDNITMNIGDTYSFVFPIEMPNTTENLLKKTYFNHGVYFSRITEAGIVTAKVSSPKLGVRMARKYDLDLDVFKAYSVNKVHGGSYILTDDEGNTQTITLDNNGSALVKGLYVDKEYKLQQYSTPYKYIKDTEEKTFKVSNNNDDSLELNYNGTYRKIEYTNNNVLDIDLNMEVLYTLDLHNIDVDSNADIKNTIFKVTGKNHESGTNITTDSTGHAYLSNMVLGEAYNIEQVRIDNYAKVNSFKIKIERDPNTHEVKILYQKYPILEVSSCDSSADSSLDGYDRLRVKIANRPWSSTAVCDIKLDLTEYREKYKITGNAYVYDYISSSTNPYLKLSLVKDRENVEVNPFLTLEKTSSANTWRTLQREFSVNKAYENNNGSWQEVDLKGGSVYYLHMNNKKSSWNGDDRPYAQILYVQARSLESDIEFLFQDEKENVNPKDNNDVYQTIKKYSVNEEDNPVLEVEVRNKYIEKGTLEITKVDAETNELLTGAQYKITGPGLPEKGKYVTIGEDGKGSVELNLSYTGDTHYIPGLNSNYPRENTYTIEEIIPPIGYSIDNKPISFMLTANATYDSTTGTISYTYKLNYDLYQNANNKFPEFEVDGENKLWKVTMKDYPLVKVTKTDDETGELLPNTYYVVYKINRVSGREEEEFAKDSDGNYIGEKITIDGQEYYVVKTNENGSLTLNLPSGQYKLKEIQAADDKYEISNEVHYFGIGETIPYQAAGATLRRGKAITDSPADETSSKIYSTSDGGYLGITLTNSYAGSVQVTKYNENYEAQWVRILTANFRFNYYYGYFDDPDRLVQYSAGNSSDSYMSYYEYKEYDDGYYFGLDYNDIIKLNKETGEIIFESGLDKPVPYIYEYTEYCDIPEGRTTADYQAYQLNPLYDDKYYCNSEYKPYNYYSYYDYEPHISFSDDGYIYVISKMPGDGHYGYILKDGTKINPEPRIKSVTTNSWGNSYSYYNSHYLLKMDKEADILEVTPLDSIIYDAKKNFFETYLPDLNEKINEYLVANYNNGTTNRLVAYEGFTYPDESFEMNYSLQNIKVLPNGDICFVASTTFFNYTYKYLDWNYNTAAYDTERTKIDSFYGNIVVRMDKNFNIIYLVPLAENANALSDSNDGNHIDQPVIFNDDGSFEYAKGSYVNMGVENYLGKSTSDMISNYVYNTEWNQFDPKVEEGHIETREGYSNYNGYSSYAVFKWGNDGKPIDWVELERNGRDPNKYDTTNDMRRMYHYRQNIITLTKVDDGYIVGTPTTYSGFYTNSDPYRYIELKSGEMVKLEDKTTFVLYKVNDDSSIEWIKQYGNIYSDRYGVYRTPLIGNKILMYKRTQGVSSAVTDFGAENGQIVTSSNDLTMGPVTGSSNQLLLEFELLDEVTPEAPEAFTLNLTNKRKEYKINITNNEGGTFTINNNDGDILYQGSEPGEVEKVKHGDDSVNTIKVKANSGYEIKDITVNGDPAEYTVMDDGTIIIDKFTGVTEEKNINVTFERGMSRVVVHHYLKGTTTKVFSDELLTGRIESDYITEAKADRLYSLTKDEYDEYIIPNNYKGKFTLEPIEVTYYYEVNMVDLRVNFYKNNTDTSLAESIFEQHELGFEYFTEAAQIPHYKVANILGNEHGIMDNDLTEVTYFYDDASTGVVTVKHVSNTTGTDIVTPITKVIEVGSTYETEALNPAPGGYVYASRTDNYRGTITEENQSITVIYYYDTIKANVITKHIDADTREEITTPITKEYSYGTQYTTNPSSDVVSRYRLKNTPENASGTVYEDNITVVYEYDRIKSHITVRYIDPETNKDVTTPKEVIVNLGDEYTTTPIEPEPREYNLTNIPDNASGIADSEDIEVVYEYTKKDSNIKVRYVDPETNKDINEPEKIVVKIGDKYTTKPLDEIPTGYKLKETPSNASGIAYDENIEVVYYYQRLREVKSAVETGDNIIKFVAISLVSIIGIILAVIIVKKNKKA